MKATRTAASNTLTPTGKGAVVVVGPFAGGIISDAGGIRTHTFNSSGNLVYQGPSPVTVDYLVVAGGGGGRANYANRYSAGSGAGGFLSGSLLISSNQVVIVGAGGALSANGSDSLLGSIQSIGGGTGGQESASGAYLPTSGGSSGGSMITNVATATSGQGNIGGLGGGTSGAGQRGGGGGGAALKGGDVNATVADDGSNIGGAGKEWPIGSGKYYAGGGGARTTTSRSLGGGGYIGDTAAVEKNGLPNTGGGAAGNWSAIDGGIGGSGIVIIRYPYTPPVGGGTADPFSGGIATDVASFRYRTFNSSGTLTLVGAPTNVDYMVVAGGGAGSGNSDGNGAGAGGGAGGVLVSTGVSISSSQVVTIGAGGATAANKNIAGNGSNSSLGAVIATGGGGGGAVNGANGGSGGGGGYFASYGVGGTGVAGQGNAGGNAGGSFGGGGGGGATAIGQTAAGVAGGNGGAGLEWPTGSTKFYGGGGGGEGYTGATNAPGGIGGGGRGGIFGAGVGERGTPNTGGGGGGVNTISEAPVGGSGTVIVRYPNAGLVPLAVPETIPGLISWWDASDAASIIATGSEVTQWKDKSGNGFNAIQNVTAKYPLTGVSTLNGKNVLAFDGIAQHLFINSGQLVNPTNGEWSGFAVVKPSNVTGTRGIVGQANTAMYFRHSNATVNAVAYDSTPTAFVESSSVVSVIGSAKAYSAVRGPTSVELWIDGVTNGPLATTGTPATAGPFFTLGYIGVGFFMGDIAEVILYNKALTTVERQQIESYLKTKWGTA